MSDIEKSVLERALFDSIVEILMTGQAVGLEGFGYFEVIHRPSRIEVSSPDVRSTKGSRPHALVVPPTDLVRFQDSNFPSK